MKIRKEIVNAILYNESKEGKIIEDTITSHGRWSVGHTIIFEYQGKYYSTRYSIGATECQDESPFEYDGPEIECVEVRQVEKVVKVWEPV